MDSGRTGECWANVSCFFFKGERKTLCHATVTAIAPNPQQSFLTVRNFDGLFALVAEFVLVVVRIGNVGRFHNSMSYVSVAFYDSFVFEGLIFCSIFIYHLKFQIASGVRVSWI